MKLPITTLDRYLIRELVNAWLMALLVFVGFLLAAEVLGKGIELIFLLKAPVTDAVRWFLLALPNLIALSLPMSVLLAVVMTLGRMSRDYEILAAQALGIGFHRLTVPVALLSLLVAVLSLWLNAFVVPPTYAASDTILWRYRSATRGATSLRIVQPPKGPPRLILSADRFYPASGLMEKVDLWEMVKEEGQWRYLKAEKAYWRDDRWTFLNGSVQIILPKRPSLPAPFARLDLQARLPPPEQAADTKAQSPNRLDLIGLTAQIQQMKRWRVPDEYVREYAVEWHNRFSLALSCIVLALIGGPVALHLKRSGGLAIGVSVLLIVIYYIIWKVGGLLGQSAVLPPA
ncbi:MAG: LptF/LptG family permease, partial [Armatimonadetes bacterium]|nr:LptF/LptG family permease [Armatimonadota bacterium]